MAKERCNCGKTAVWLYMPSSNIENPFYCDDCVVSPEDKYGCSCNWNYAKEQEGLPTDLPEGIEEKDWRWVENEEMGITKNDGYWVYLDKQGRPSPCVEYDYSEDGFDVPTFWTRLADDIWWTTHSFKQSVKRWWKRHVIDEVPPDQDF